MRAAGLMRLGLGAVYLLVLTWALGQLAAGGPPPPARNYDEAGVTPASPLPGSPPTATAAPDTPLAHAVATVSATPPPASALFEQVAHFLLTDVARRRADRARADPGYWHRVDPALNEGRVNVLLFGYGETHEPPLTERAFIGSYTLVSYDRASGAVDLVSLTHDIRAPELERVLQPKQATPVGPIKIDQAYTLGGFELMRQTLEDATGLSVDAAVAFDDAAIAGLVDQVLGGLDVDIPVAFTANAFYLQGVKYPGTTFAAGRQHLNGLQVIQFIKTVPVETTYDKRLEHNARKHLVLSSLMDALRPAGNPTQVPRAALFLNGALADGTVAFDFDARAMLTGSFGELFAGGDHAAQPHVEHALYVCDPASGDGSVEWVRANMVFNTITRRDVEEHRYGDLAMEVPYHGDPYAPDLVAQYWSEVRALVRDRLTRR
jgi:LytR_cpsA_psr family